MGLKAKAAKLIASWEVRRNRLWMENPDAHQLQTFYGLLENLQATAFGRSLSASRIRTYEEWKSAIPTVDYEGLRPWIERIQHGEHHVLWPGKPLYFCKTSGTTSGTKFIPMSKDGIQAQVRAARSALLHHVHTTGDSAFVDGKMMFLQGNPSLEKKHGIATGRLSGIVAHHVPAYLQNNRLPSWQVNCMDNWEQKVDAIVRETAGTDLRLISGIPPWVQMYFERLLNFTGKSNALEVFPNLSLFVHGGVNYAPYRTVMDKLIGRSIDSIETYPASEGFIGFDDSSGLEGMLLNLDAGIFYEFIPSSEVHLPNPTRLPLSEVSLGVDYAIVLNTSSGLWGYVIGDTIRFTSLRPYRIAVTGRISHFISAFGEHVIASEVEAAITHCAHTLGIHILEFHVAPQVTPNGGLPYHEWFVECEQPLPFEFASQLDIAMRQRNTYYNDLVAGAVLRPLIVREVARGSFHRYMERHGKLGGQNKLPRLSNDRKIAAELGDFINSL